MLFCEAHLSASLLVVLRKGQLSVQRAILTVKAWGKHSESIAAFVEESVVR